MKKIICAVLFMFIALSANAQLGVAVVIDPTNLAQNVLQAARILEQINQTRQYLLEFDKHLKEQLKLREFGELNLKANYTSVLSQYTQHFNQLQGQLQQLRGIINNSPANQATTIQMIESRYNQLYFDQRAQLNGPGITGATITQWLQTFTKVQDDRQIQLQQDAMLVGGMTLRNVQQSQQQLASASTASQNAQGSLSAIQAGNQVNTRVAAELMQLNTMLAVQNQLENEERAAIQSRARASAAQYEMDRRARMTNSRPGAAGQSWWRQ